MNIRLLPEAVDEADEAALRYDTRRSGLKEEFHAELDLAWAAIEERSHGMPALEGYSGLFDVRRHLLKRFPYVVIFAYDEQECLIVAVAHTRRKPLYWLDRLN